MFEIYAQIPLFSEHNVTSYRGMAFDGGSYYLTAKGKKKMVKCDRNFQNMETITTRRIYTAICYDSGEGCFWAASGGSLSVLFKLNRSLQEVAQMEITEFGGAISGISAMADGQSLLVSIGEKLLRLEKSGPQNIEVVESGLDTAISGVTALSDGYLYHYINGDQKLRVVAGDGSVLGEYSPLEGHLIEQVLYLGQEGAYDEFELLTLKQDTHPYLLKAKMERDMLAQQGYEEDYGSCPDACERKICGSCGQDVYLPTLSQLQGSSCQATQFCLPNKPCRPHKPCPPKPPCSSCQSCNQVLESVALVEASIAHILNAEGEKIQKAVASSCCISDMLKVNKEVTRTIIHVTHLEQVLFDKLDALRDCFAKPNGLYRGVAEADDPRDLKEDD